MFALYALLTIILSYSHYFLPSSFISNIRLEVILAGPWCHNPTQPSHLKNKQRTKIPPTSGSQFNQVTIPGAAQWM